MCQTLDRANILQTCLLEHSVTLKGISRHRGGSSPNPAQSVAINGDWWCVLWEIKGFQGRKCPVFVELQDELTGDAAVCAQMCVGVRNGDKMVQKPADHRFDSVERDWGFNQFQHIDN